MDHVVLYQITPPLTLRPALSTPLPQSAPSDLAAYGVKERLVGRWREVAGPSPGAANEAAGGSDGSSKGSGKATGKGSAKDSGGKGSGKDGSAGGCGDFVSEQQRALFALLSCYSDMLRPCRPYPASKEPGGALVVMLDGGRGAGWGWV